MDLQPVEGDPFSTPQQAPSEGLTPVNSDPFSGASALQQDTQTPFDQAKPEAGLMPVEGNPFGPSPPSPPESVVAGAPETQPSKPGAVSRGFVTGLLQGNPEMGAHGLEMLADIGPEATASTLRSGAQQLRKLSQFAPAEYQTKAPGLYESLAGGLDPTLTKVGETFGQGLASTLPSLITGLGGVAAGSAVGGAPGAIAGGVTGAFSTSYLMNSGEVRKALLDEGVDSRLASRYAAIAGLPISVLDTASVGPIIARLGGIQEVKREVARAIAKRVAAEGALGATREGVTEAAQEVLKMATVSLATDKPFWSMDNVEPILENALGGALVGGALGSASGLRRDRIAGKAPTEEQIRDTLAHLQSTTVDQLPAKDLRESVDQLPETSKPNAVVAEPSSFYVDAVAKATESLPEVAPASQISEALQTDTEVKPEEWKALGISEILADPQKEVTKEELVSTIERAPAFNAKLDDILAQRQKFAVSQDASLGLEVLQQGVDLRPAVRQMSLAFQELAKRMGVEQPIRVTMTGRAMAEHGMLRRWTDENGKPRAFEIALNMASLKNTHELYAIFSHEFGHLISHVHLAEAPDSVKMAIRQEHAKWRMLTQNMDSLRGRMALRNNYITETINQRDVGNADRSVMTMTSEERAYWLGFEEWFAEQAAKWMTTSAKPIGIVEKFFAGLGRKLKELYAYVQTKFGQQYAPSEIVKGYLDSLVSDASLSSFQVMQAMEAATLKENKNALIADGIPYVEATEQTLATEFSKNLVSALGLKGEDSKAARSAAAMADRFNKFYNLMLSMVQLAARNPHIAELQRYRELWQVKQVERTQIMDGSLRTLKAWRKLGPSQSDSVSGLIDDYMNLKFLSEEERAKKVIRRPTQEEFSKLVRENKVNDQGLAVFQQVVLDFDNMLTRYGEILVGEASKISDPAAQATRLQAIAEQIAALRKQPYFPAMRFGDLTLTIRDNAGKVIHFETFESRKKRASAERELRGQLANGETLQLGVLAKDAAPMIGMPTGILDAMAEKLALSPSQRGALEQLRFELAPAQSFKHRFQRKSRVEGYSSDFMRAYANYFFHGSNYFTNVKYVDALRDQVKGVRESARLQIDGTKRGQIANFLSDHLAYSLDPKPDFAFFRGLAFLWYLGFSPASAALNMTQMVVGSYPFLASKFGDLKTIASMTRAGTQTSTFYQKARLSTETDRELRAISEGVKEGVITEAMAPELAAISEGRNLGQGFGGNAAARLWQHFNEASSMLFEMSEQMNRRITFRAAFKLATENPAAPFVAEAKAKHALQYQRLRDAGWTETDAGAFVVAKEATEATQFVYQQYAQPRFMRGKLKTVFIFKSFLQNTLFMLWNYPSAAIRSVLIMALLGGLMGVPGAEDLRGIIKALAYRLFGKDFDIEDEARKLVLDTLHGRIPPDLLLHGMARRGFGIPALGEMLGFPLPTFDRSKSIGMGQISPVDVGALFGPGASKDQARAISDTSQRASGAVFGSLFNLYKALTDGVLDWNDFKRWERAMPREMASLSKAYRALSEGRERDRNGNTVVNFDTSDPRQMMEMIGLAMGYQPLRVSAQWDRRIAEIEAISFWNIRREGLLRQLWSARADKETYARALGAVRKFNEEVAGTDARGKAITADTIRQSFQTRARAQASRESGVPKVKGDIPIAREIQRLYPEAEVDVRKVR